MGTPKYDIGIIGSGIIGLATAMRLSHEHPRSKIVVVEKESQIAQHQTGHNSGVIHAGICYAPGSQKANFCSTGGAMLRRFCDQHEVPYEMCGKLIVAVDESEVPGLEELFRRGTANARTVSRYWGRSVCERSNRTRPGQKRSGLRTRASSTTMTCPPPIATRCGTPAASLLPTVTLKSAT